MSVPASPVNPFLYLQANADSNPNGFFSRSATASVTNAEAVVEAKKIAYELRRLGVRAGDIVALDLPDQLSILFTEAVYHEGAISTVLPEGYTADGVLEIGWVFSNRTPRAQGNAALVTVDARFLQQVDQNPYGISPSEEPIETLRVIFSSGTTGTPNAIALSREAVLPFEDATATWFQGDPFLVLLDTGTPWGFGGFYLSVKTGAPFLCVGGAEPADVVRVADQNRVTSVKGSPAQVASLVAELEVQDRTLTSIETVFVGGTMMPPGVADRMRAVAEGCEIFSMYGSTETGIATSRLYESDDPSNGGYILAHALLEVVDESDVEVPTGTPGRIRHQTPGMVHEYIGDPETSRKVFRDGWFYPGDLGLIRPDGGVTLTGRESEILNAGGVKLDPTLLDNFALQFPGVIDACSFDYSTASGIRAIGLAIVAEDGIEVERLVADLGTTFSVAAPGLVARIDAVPRNAMGKPIRRTLALRYSES